MNCNSFVPSAFPSAVELCVNGVRLSWMLSGICAQQLQSVVSVCHILLNHHPHIVHSAYIMHSVFSLTNITFYTIFFACKENENNILQSWNSLVNHLPCWFIRRLHDFIGLVKVLMHLLTYNIFYGLEHTVDQL